MEWSSWSSKIYFLYSRLECLSKNLSKVCNDFLSKLWNEAYEAQKFIFYIQASAVKARIYLTLVTMTSSKLSNEALKFICYIQG